MPKKLFRSVLVQRLLIYSVALGVTFIVLSIGWILYFNYLQFQQEIEENFEHIAQQTPSISSSLYALDQQQIELQLEGLLNLPGVIYLQIEVDADQSQQAIFQGDPAAHRDRTRQFPLTITNSFSEFPDHLGILTAVISMDYIYKDLKAVVISALAISVLGISIIIIAVFLLFHFQVIRHLLSITEFTSQLDLNQLDRHLQLNKTLAQSGQLDEVDQLVKAVNDMRSRLQKGVAEQIIAHQQLKLSETNLRTLIETIPDLVWVTNMKGEYLLCNPRFEHLLGAKESEIVGKTIFDFTDYERATISRQLDIQAVANTGVTVNEEEVLFADDGHVETVETVKKPMYDSDGDLVGVLSVSRDITERVRVKQKLKLQDELLNEMGRLANIGGWEFEVDSGKGVWTEQAARIYEMEQREETSINICVSNYYDESRELIEQAVSQAIESAKPYDLVLNMVTSNGVDKIVRTIGQPLVKDNKVVKLRGSIQDITEQKQTEKALQRSQKMDAVGQLTGGIAHDFNNILGILMGNLELLNIQIDDRKKVLERIVILKKSTQRATDLTRQLLSFSRDQPAKTHVTDINKVIQNMDSLVSRTVTPSITVEYSLADDLRLTEIDTGDLEDALLNLVLNARDVIAGNGQLTIETRNCKLDEAYCLKNVDAQVGDYVQLAVSDNGAGIPQELHDRIFEPFFTTKDPGKGTGLGLAMVYGFAKRSGGSIKIYSEPGIGSTFRLYLPRVDNKEIAELNTIDLTEPTPGGTETLLVVDDEIDLLSVTEEFLSLQGYRVITANDANQALFKLAEYSDISLLFSDVVIPGEMNGYELAENAVKEYPYLKVLLTSGYTQKVVARNGQARFDAMLLTKPFTQVELAQNIRNTLDN